MAQTAGIAPTPSKPLDWVNIAFLTVTPVIAVVGTAWYAWNYGVTKL